MEKKIIIIITEEGTLSIERKNLNLIEVIGLLQIATFDTIKNSQTPKLKKKQTLTLKNLLDGFPENGLSVASFNALDNSNLTKGFPLSAFDESALKSIKRCGIGMAKNIINTIEKISK